MYEVFREVFKVHSGKTTVVEHASKIAVMTAIPAGGQQSYIDTFSFELAVPKLQFFSTSQPSINKFTDIQTLFGDTRSRCKAGLLIQPHTDIATLIPVL